MRGMMKAVKLAISSIFKPVTVKYPAGRPEERYSQVPQVLRGRHQFDEQKCTGCGACVQQCSSNALQLGEEEETREISVDLGNCVFCMRCEIVCPEEAIRLTTAFELSYPPDEEEEKRFVRNHVELRKCENCDDPFVPEKQVERILERILENIDARGRDEIERDYEVYSKCCPTCRATFSLRWGTHTRKFYLQEVEGSGP